MERGAKSGRRHAIYQRSDLVLVTHGAVTIRRWCCVRDEGSNYYAKLEELIHGKVLVSSCIMGGGEL